MGVQHKSKKKAVPVGEAVKKRVHKKVPGFQAFAKNKIEPRIVKNDGNMKVAASEVEAATEPEEGIHSIKWANAIVPQAGFLGLAFEIRKIIYKHVIEDFSIQIHTTNGRKYIQPRKNGNKFKSVNWIDPARDTERLAMICRQTYVDIVGSGLIYSMFHFNFTSPKSLLNYMLVIHPVHKDAVTSISLTMTISSVPRTLQPLTFELLASMPNLKILNLQLNLKSWVFNPVYQNPNIPNQFRTPILGYMVNPALLTAIKTAKELVGNGKKDSEGGEGGVRGLDILEMEFVYVDNLEYFDEWEAFHKVVDELRAIMEKGN